MDFRHAGVTVTAVGGTDARLAMVTPCGAIGQPHGFMYLNFDENDEKLILQPGEGIALIADSAGDADQLIRLVIEWQEVTITPSSQNEYLISSGVITGLAFPANTTFFTFFNPSGSGRTVLVKRLLIRNDTGGAANYAAFSWRRLIAASGGILIAAASIPKKHTDSGNSAMQIRWCGSACGTAISATYSGSVDSRLLTVNGPGAVGQVIGHKEIVFGNNEKLVLQQGEGIGFYIETSGNANFYVKVMIEWQEITTSSLAQSEYLVDIGPVNGSTTANYVYASVFNPAASGRIFVVKRISLRIDAAAAAVYIPMSLRRITSASGGTQITSANIPKKNSGSSDSVADIRRTGVTVNFVGSANARLVSVTTPGAVGASAAPHINGYQEFIFKDDEKLILKNGEGIALYQENAATNNTNLRVKILIEWQEITNSPAFQGEYLFYSGNILGNIASGYVYSSFFNPLNSGKNYLIKRMGVRVDRTGAATTATYIPLSVRKVNSASGGTLINATDILAKNTSALTSTAEIRTTSPTVNFIQANESRILGVTQPGAVGENYGIFELEIVFQDELMLAPGEGFALYQESNAGDTNFVVRLGINWSEINITYNQSAYRFFSNLDSTDVGGPLASQVASQDTAAILSFPGQAFRLRLLLHVATGTLPLSGQGFKLQFAQRGSDNQCDINFSGENYSDVTTTTAIAYHNNLTPADGVALTANANDPIHGSDTVVNQTYEEVNNFTNSISPILSGQDGKWDFSLRDNNAPLSTSYCFRIVKSDGSLLDTYSLIPQITTASPVVSVSVSDGTVNYGIMPVNTAKSTLSGELNDMQTATNDGNLMEIFNIKGIDASGGGCNWNLASNNGVNQYVHQFCNDTANDCSTPPANYIALTTSYQTLATNISPSGKIDFHLRIGTPTSTNSYAQQNVDVTVQAVAY